MKYKILLLSISLTLPVVGFEINTHQAITNCALSANCIKNKNQQGAENLNYFALTMQLNRIDYTDHLFNKYEPYTYFDYAKKGD